MFRLILTGVILSVGTLFAEDAKTNPPKAEEAPESFVETRHSVKINGTDINYRALAGKLQLKDEHDKDKASIFYVAYFKEGEDASKRPITFVFNGGPGSSSVWLHMGAFGPRRVEFIENGSSMPPYQVINNEYSLLDLTDLVFIDPVATGFSRPAPGEEAKQFFGVDEDIESVAKFIRLFTTKNGRWLSPKYIAGESYGTTRAAGLSAYLHNEMKFYINGVILVSSILNFQALYDPEGGNDLPYMLFLPSFTATAWYHEKLSPELQKDLKSALAQSESFALKEYAGALLKGDKLSGEEKVEIAKRLSEFTGLSPEFIERSNLRVNISRFAKELLRQKKRTVGRFDSRYLGIDSDAAGETFEADPSAEAIFGRFTGAFNDYVLKDLGWKEDREYQVLAKVTPWNYGKATNAYLNFGEKLREVMSKTPGLKVFVGNGYYDLATPYFTSDYTFDHLSLDPTLRPFITMAYYESGHMMYIHLPSLAKLKKDLTQFYQSPQPIPSTPVGR